MNTERPDNDDADRSALERGAGGSVQERGAAEKKDASGEPGTASAGVSGGERDSSAAGASGDAEAVEATDAAEARDAVEATDAVEAAEASSAEQGSGGAEAASEAEADSEVAAVGASGSPEPSGAVTSDSEAAGSAGAGTDGGPAGASADADEGPAAQAPPTGPEASTAQAPDTSPDIEIPRDEHDRDEHDRVRDGRTVRRRSPAVVVSVAAAVLVVGGGGAYFATTADDGSGGGRTAGASGGGTPPPLALDGYSEGGGTNGIAPGEPNPYGVTYRAAGALPDGPGSAPVYRTGGQVSENEVAALAEALGVDGRPVSDGQSWTVGAKDGAGPGLQVNRQAPGSWTFHRYSPGTDNCKSATVCAQAPADPGGDPVSEAVARKAAAPVLKAVGQDDTKVDASRTLGAQRIVNAEPVIGDLPTYGWTTDVIVNAQGEVVSGSGRLEAPVKGDTYPVLSAQDTLALMNAAPGTDHRMGIGGCASPVPLKDRLEAPCGSKGSATAAPAKETLTVEKAVFGLAPHLVDGRQTLVPSWLFDVRAAGAQDDFTVTHPAVDPKYVTSPTPSAEPGSPSTRPTGPGDEPTAAPATKDVQVDGYTAEGRELTVSFTGGVCADYRATATESGDEVTVKVTETPWPDKVCILIAKVYEKTVQLDEPLGDRKVVGSDGKEIPLRKAGARLPETSGAR